jgi:hypothetical protein
MKHNSLGIFCILIYAINRFAIKSSGIDFIDYHLDDFLAPVIILFFTERLMSLIYKRPFISLPYSWIIFTAFYISFFFEIILPYYYPERFTDDPKDIAAYFGGALFYTLFMKPEKGL